VLANSSVGIDGAFAGSKAEPLSDLHRTGRKSAKTLK